MQTIGQFFKENRLQQKLSPEEAAQRLLVSRDFIQKIEGDDFENLPAEVYLKGFVKKYAQLLHLNELRALALFRRSYLRSKEETAVPPQPIKKKLFTLTPRTFINLAISVIIIGFLGFLYWQYRNYAGKPLLVVTSPADRATIYQDYVEVIGQTDPDAKLYINGQESYVSEDGSFAVAVGLNPGHNQLIVTARWQSGARKQSGKESVVKKEVEVINRGS